jgi:hypothetical protein
MRTGNRRSCIVCSSPPEVLDIINRMIADRAKYLDIEKATGLGHSSIHRHRHDCLNRQILLAFKTKRERYFKKGRRFIVAWEGRSPRYTSLASPDGFDLLDTEFRKDDILVVVSYDKLPNLDAAHSQALNDDRIRSEKISSKPETAPTPAQPGQTAHQDRPQ